MGMLRLGGHAGLSGSGVMNLGASGGIEIGGISPLPFRDDFDRADGALGNGWTASTYAISTNKIVNTPTAVSERITNGGFDDGTGWILQTNWVIGGGVLTATGVGANTTARQNNVFEAKKWYAITFTLTGLSGGSIYVRDTAGTFWTVSANGTHTMVVFSSGGNFFFQASDAGTNAVLDNLSVMELSGLFATRRGALNDMAVGVRSVSMVRNTTTYHAPAGVVMCLDDPANPQNYIMGYTTNAGLRMDKIIAGVRTQLFNVAFPATSYIAGGPIHLVRRDRNKFQLYYEFVAISTEQTISDTELLSNQYCGIISGDAGAPLDDAWGAAISTPRRISIIGDSIPSSASKGDWVWPISLCIRYHQGVNLLFNHALGNMGVIVGASNMAAQATACATDNADIIIMALGTNDDNAGNMATLQAAVEAGIDTVRATNPNATIYYMNVLPRTTGDKSNIRTAIAAACAVKSVTCWDTVTDPWIDPATDCSDGLHPTTAGYDKIVARLLSRI